MQILAFYNAINELIEKEYGSKTFSSSPAFIQAFLINLESILKEPEASRLLKITRMTILFEGFYRSLPNEIELKKKLLPVKISRWSKHFGTPTLSFSISYKYQINQTSQYFYHIQANLKEPLADLPKPWNVNNSVNSVIDEQNNIIVDPKAIQKVTMPEHEEITGSFTKTHNPSGGFTTTPCDPFSQQFIEHASKKAKRVLEIGAGFGAATLSILAKTDNIVAFCNDIDPQNLAVVHNRFTKIEEIKEDSINGDYQNLILIPGAFPEELTGLPENSFDAILICRLLHFFPGKKIENSLKEIAKLLVPGGKIYIVCETPYLNNWQKFIPEFNARIAKNVEWPGEITNPAEFECSGRVESLPKFVHWITEDVLKRILNKANFDIDSISYINRQGQFPNDLLLPIHHPDHGKESIGAIGKKSTTAIL